MMLTIHGLPPNIKYHELKLIIKRECGINDFILGTLAADSDGTKKARIGIIDEQEGNVLTKYLDGYRLSGHVIRIVPIEKSTNEIHQSTFNNSGHQWRSNQQGQNFGKPLDTFNQNQIQVWSEQSNQPWVANQSVLPQQAPTLSNYEHVQPTPGVQQYFYQQQGSLPQNKIFVQQDKFPQARNVQQHGFGSSNKNLSSNFITPQRENNPRSIAFPNSDMGQHASGRPVQTGTFIKQSYGNSEKPPILKDPFQKSYDAGSQSGQPHQGQGYNQQWVPQNQQPKTEPFSKTSPSQFGKSSYNNKLIQPDKRKGILPHPEKDPEYQYDKGGRRFSPQRVERAPGIRSSPSGHRILPSGRRISPREMTPPRRTSPSYRRVSPNDRRNISPLGRRNSPPRRRISPNERRHSPDRGISSARRRLSPTGRRVSPHGRVISPVGRRVSPDRRSPNRRISPSSRVSPVRPVLQGNRHLGQRLSPKRMSPLKQSLGRKMSPGRRSPNRGHSPRAYARYSPSQTEKQMDTVRQGSQKDVRPAFVQISQAQNQPVYSGGYSPNSSSNYKYSSTSRQSDHRPLWRDGNKVYTPPKKLDDDVRDARDARDTPRIQKLDMPRQDYPKALLSHPETKVHSQRRMSRSPNPRDRSPVRDNYSRHSPSLTSPRRSWALEKRRNADYHDIPSPPLWPERQENAFAKHNQTHDGSKIRTSRWGKPYEAEPEEAVPRKEEYDNRDRENRKYNVSPNRSHWGPLQRSSLPFNDPTDRDSPPLQSRTGDRYTQKLKDSKFSPRDDYNAHHRKQFQGAHEREARFDRHDHKDAASKQELNDDYRSQINERKENLYVGDENLNRELEDVFKRVAKYTTKTNEYLTRKSEKRSYPSVDYRRMEQEDEEVYAFDKRNSRDDGPGPSSHGYYDESMSRYKRNLGIRNFDLNPNIQYKRDKAVDEITGKILIKFASDLKGKVRDDVEERLKFTVENMIFEMYGEKDVSFIEIVIKFADKYSLKDMEKIFDNVMSEFPTEIRRSKRYAPDDEPHVASKIARSSPTADLKKDVTHLPVQSNQWNVSMIASPVVVPQNPLIAPLSMMLPVPFAIPTLPPIEPMPQLQEGFIFYLCKENFQAFNETQAAGLREFIIKKIVQETQFSNGWAPDLTLRGVQNEIRYEIWTSDEKSRDWLMELDFKDFTYFNVMIYTSEEVWYERAAVWLPSNDKKHILTPLDKLKLQNRFMVGVNINLWKLVKQIVTVNGTRLYVDIPPSSARALRHHNMSLSYELQKVQVFLRAEAVDKNAFDAGLKETSLTVVPESCKQHKAMPAINSQDSNIVKICLSNNTINLALARRVKDLLIRQIYKYIQEGGRSRTDFLKYGYCKPGYFCVIPENEETAKWINDITIGKINGQMINILGGPHVNTKYFTLTSLLPCEQNLTPKKVLEKLKTSNRGVNGLKFNLWKKGHLDKTNENRKLCYHVDVDIDSAEAIMQNRFFLDYSHESRSETIFINFKVSNSKLSEIIDKCRAENTDTVAVTNMDISSDEEEDVICLD
ncbi:uncharacterized protein [Battus philenor]|uniref:uncharacterized protein isoform X5 n=1 Tax=Battus philenor TaxID=42288 RepID=UPI0035D0FAF9